MKITIAGGGRVGTVIATQLIKEQHDITIIDRSEENVQNIANTLDIMPVVGDAVSAQILLNAEVDKSDLMIAVTDSDIVNLMICILAKKIGVPNTIARIREPDYWQTVTLIKEDTGLSFTVNPERDAAKEILRSLLFKGAGQVETFAQGSNEVMTVVVRQGNPVAGLKIRDLSRYVKKRILVCAIKRGQDIFIPNADTEIQENDTLSFVARRSDAVHFFRKMKYDTGRISNLVIIGGGKLGFYLASMALSEDISVKIIDKDPAICRQLNELLPYAEIILGDGTDIAVLEESGVFSAAAVATTMGSDEKNVLVSMFLTKQCPNMKVITKIKKSDFEDMLYGIDIGNVFNPKYIAADRVITYVRAMQETVGNEVRSICHVIDNKLEVLEFHIDESSVNLGRPLQDLKLRPKILLAGITRNGESFIPGAQDSLEVGDTVLVTTTEKNVSSFGDIFA